MKKKWLMIVAIALVSSIFAVKFHRPSKVGKLSAVDYAICKKETQPKELQKIIQKEKRQPFGFTFTTGDLMYLVVGYGRQERSNYRVKLNSLKEDQWHIYMKTSLIGVKKKKVGIMPYLVVKCLKREKDVIFQ